ncbi:putative PQ loop repeat protein [Rosellinia necatrix]|uniref:Putative PQ loop repeat protein n=1 Tax=Rosellinia necatrix TaxID=77044 RepID=A0A1W2TSW0_ROSNE|nr:putative PQ loop repeat protein [Rosellinia necatrix]
MAPQEEIPIAANVLGTIGTVLWSIQLVPQAWTNWRTKSTEGLPSIMMFLWAISGVPFGIYAIKWPLWRAIVVVAATAALFAGVEVALILTLRPVYKAGNEIPVIVVGVVSAILLAVGLLPPYGEAWKRRGRIIGINFVFLAMDSLGAFFSLLSLGAQHTFDILGGVMYILVILLEIGIFSSHLIWLFRTRQIRKRAKLDGKTFDDVMAEHEQQGLPFQFTERTFIWPWEKRTDGEEMGCSNNGESPGPRLVSRGGEDKKT